MEMENRVFNYIEEKNLIEKGDKVLVALSGGPDSVFLLYILSKLKERLGIEIGACHLNHCLRGEDSEGDEKFSRILSEKLGIDYYSKTVRIKELSMEIGKSIEETARIARYEFFEETMKEKGYDKTALAHNLNDQSETVLQRLFRGTGIKGLRGISPLRDLRFIRPVLFVKRAEIEEYLEKEGIESRRDKTNFEEEYMRNKIRLKIIPYIKDNFNENIEETLSTMADNMVEDDEFIEEEGKKLFLEYSVDKKDRGRIILKKEVFSYPKSPLKRAIIRTIEELKGDRLNISAKSLEDILDISSGETGKMINLPENLTVSNNYGDIYFDLSLKGNDEESVKKEEESVKEELLIKILKEPQSIIFGKYILTIFISDVDAKIKGTKKVRAAGLKEVIIRTRKEGDSIIPLGMKGSKKLKKIFIDEKILREERDHLPLITDTRGKIIYLHLGDDGITGENFKVREEDKEVIFFNIRKLKD